MTTSSLGTTTATPPCDARRGAWADLAEVVGDFWRYREPLYEFTLCDIIIRYRQAVMGFAWALFMPVLIVVADWWSGSPWRIRLGRDPSAAHARQLLPV